MRLEKDDPSDICVVTILKSRSEMKVHGAPLNEDMAQSFLGQAKYFQGHLQGRSFLEGRIRICQSEKRNLCVVYSSTM